MLEVLLTAIPSLCWMLFRCYQLFKTPTHKLGSSLNLDIPHTPTIYIDSLDKTSVVLHWDIETQPDENIFYVILINGHDAGTLAQNAVKLTNLDSNFLYKLQIVAINVVSNFRSQSDAIYVRTLPEKTQMKKLIDLTQQHDLSKISGGSSDEVNLEISSQDIEKLSNSVTLTNYLHAFQSELARISKEFSVISSNQQAEEETIRHEIQYYKKELHDGSEARAKKELDLKQLEQQKNLLSFTKLKILKQLKNHNSQRNLNMNKLTELRLKLAKLTEKRHHVQNAADSERQKANSNVQALNADIEELKCQIHKVEDSIKVAILEKKDLSNVLSQLKPLIDQFTSKSVNDGKSSQDLTKQRGEPIFNLEGGLTVVGTELLEKIYLLQPEWAQNLNHELETLHRLESSWKNTFRLSLRKYLSVYNGLEALKAAADPTYVPKKKSEHKASVEFGGHAFALPKSYQQLGDGDSSFEFNEALADNWYDLSKTNEYESPVVSSQVSVVGMQPMNDVLTAPQTSFLAQQEYPDFEPYIRGQNDNRSQEAWNGFLQIPSISLPQQSTELYTTPLVEPPMVSAPQIFGPNYSDLLNMVTGRQILANALSPPNLKQTMSQNSQNSQQHLSTDFENQQFLNTDGHSNYQPQAMPQAIPQPMQQPMFPYSSPPSEQSLLLPSNQPSHLQTSLWSNQSQNSLVDSRMQFTGLTLPKANQLSPTISQQSNLGIDRVYMNTENMYNDTRGLNETSSLNDQNQYDENAYINQNLLYNHSGFLNKLVFPQSSIWLDNPMAPSYSHNRTVSSGSQLWRNDNQRADKTRTNEFSPFQSDLESERNNDTNYDIRLI